MVKLKLKTNNTIKKRISVRLPIGMLARLDDELLKSNYSKKERSLWFEDAFREFAMIEDKLGVVAEEFMSPGASTLVTFTLSKDTDVVLEDIAINAEKDKSSVVRTVITQKLIKSKIKGR